MNTVPTLPMPPFSLEMERKGKRKDMILCAYLEKGENRVEFVHREGK